MSLSDTMRFIQFLIFLLLVDLPLIYSTVTETTHHDNHPPFEYTFCSTNKGNYTANSVYNTNLRKLLSSLPSYDNGFGFYNSSRGQNPNKAYAIGLCRGDVTPDDCGSCLSDVGYLLTQACPFQMEAIGWYQNCMLRFSNRSLHGALEVLPTFSLWHAAENVLSTDMDAFNRKLRNLLKTLRSKAAAGGDLRKFAAGSARLRVAPDSKQTIYALVQCTPDLSQIDCKRCLLQAFGYVPKCCFGEDTGRLVKPSCNLRFELSHFFNSPAAPLPLPFSDSPFLPLTDNTTNISQAGTKNGTSRTVLTISSVAAVLGVLVVIIIMIICYRHFFMIGRSQQTLPLNGSEIKFDTVRSSTGNWANRLGKGGFGSVYKGRLKGQHIAVKRLSMEYGQGDLEFSAEVSFLVNLQHQNLVKLLGFSVEGNERLLVYEFLPNSSLDRFIFDPDRRENLDWDRRHKIIIGITRGLLYLHDNPTPRIIHRDLKPSNILLDAEMDPKIADFGMARLFTDDQIQQQTIRIVGTRGYMAPEYIRGGLFSAKSDIYSLGVMILEIVSGEENTSVRYVVDGNRVGLVSYAWNKWRAQEISALIDPLLTGSRIEIKRCIKIGLLCVQDNEANRPPTGDVFAMLTSRNLASDTIPDPVAPEPEQLVFDFGSSTEGSSNFVTVPPQVPEQVSASNDESGSTRILNQSTNVNSVVAVAESPQPVISANGNSDSHIVSAPATLHTEMIRNNHVNNVEHEAYSILGKLVTAACSIASTAIQFLRGLLGNSL